MHLQTLAITINQSLIGKVRLLLTMLHHDPQTIWSGDFFVVDGTGRHGSTHQLSWAVLPKTPAGTGHPLPGGLYWEQKKTEEQGSAE